MASAKIRTVYTTCVCNCGGTSQCLLKAHVQGDTVIRVEPDDRYNPNVGREDLTRLPTGTIGRDRLVLKAKNAAELMYSTMDDD